MSVHAHRGLAPTEVPTAVITVSDTRTLSTDSGGALVSSLLRVGGHRTTRRQVVPDSSANVREAVLGAFEEEPTRAVIATGGTGIAPRDVTPETIRPLFELPATYPAYPNFLSIHSVSKTRVRIRLRRVTRRQPRALHRTSRLTKPLHPNIHRAAPAGMRPAWKHECFGP